MSPIPSVATAFTLSTVTPSLAPDPGSGGQSVPMTSIHILGTGGLLFAVVAIVSVAGYFYHGRGATNGARTSNTWAPFNSFLSAMRHRGSGAPTAAITASDWSRDPEVGPLHVDMVYAKFFHPTFWNVVEYHSGTSSRPEIYVEDEAKEVPVPGPTPPGMNSFLDMDEDDGNGNEPKLAREKPGRSGSGRVEATPPFDLGAATNVGFDSKVIGSTVRQGAFLCIPGEQEPEDDASFEDLSADSELDLSCLAYDGIVATTEPLSSCSVRRYGMADMTNLAESLKDTIPEEGFGMVPTTSHRTGLVNVAQSYEDAILRGSCGLVPTVSRRTGLKDVVPEEGYSLVSTISRRTGLANVAQSLEGTMPEDSYGLASKVSRRIGLVNVANLEGTHEGMFCGTVEHLEHVDDGLTIPECDIGTYDMHAESTQIGTTKSCRSLVSFKSMENDLMNADCPVAIGVPDSCDSLRTSVSTTDTDVTALEDVDLTALDYSNYDIGVHDSHGGLGASEIAASTDDDFHEGTELMRQILAELHGLKAEYALSDSESEYDDDDDNDDDVDKDTWRDSLESTSLTSWTEDEAQGHLIYPPTRPLKITPRLACAPGTNKGHKRSPAHPWFNEEAIVASLGSFESPPPFQAKGYVHAYRNGGSLRQGSRIEE